MGHRTVRRFEKQLGHAIADTATQLRLGKSPLRPWRHTMDLVAKAAVAVYESVVENPLAVAGGLERESVKVAYSETLAGSSPAG